MRRWQRIIEKDLPAYDIIDLTAEQHQFYPQKRQFAPEFSQKAYLSMYMNEYAIGDYISIENNLSEITSESRRHMVTLLEALNHEKDYKEETLFLAASLADRFLVNLVIQKTSAIQTKQARVPCLIQLAIVVTLMAAKLE